MALVLADRVKETTTTTGTGTVTLAGASAGYRSFATVGNGNTTYYTISGQTTSEWEVGIGTYTTVGTTLSRTTVLSSSNGGSLVVFSAGTKDVFVTYPAGRSVNVNAANTGVSVPQLSATSIINSGLTSGRVVYSTTSGLETDSANLTFSGTILTSTGFAGPINGTVGATTPSTGAFTTLSATGAITLNTTTNNQSYTTTGAGIITISSGTAGSINNMTIGATTAGTGRFSSITNTGLTSGRVVYSTTSGLETDSANLTFNGTTLTANTIGAFTLSGTIAGGGNQINNVIIGTTTPLAGAFTTLSATGVTTFSAGSAAAPAITTTGDTNTGIFFPAADTIAFTEGGAEAMRINSSGDLGIGTTSPGARLDVQNSNAYGRIKSTSGTYALFDIDSPASMQPIIRFLSNGVEQSRILAPANEGASQLVFATGTSGTERMRIDASGNVMVGTTASTGSAANTASVVGGIFTTASGTVSAATATATTIFTCPTLVTGLYLVNAQLGSNDPATYGAVSLVGVGNTTLRATSLATGTNITITVSGQTIRSTQTSGLTQTITWTVTRLS